MESNRPTDWRAFDRKLFLIVAIVFPLIMLLGFGRTYYFKMFTDAPPITTMLIHIHGIVMTAWVGLFVTQVYLIRSKRHKVHMNLGMLGIALAIVVIVVGFFTAAGLAKNGSASMPPGFPPLSFFAIPFFDLIVFSILFAGAIFYRKRPDTHKRLMLLTAIGLLPPAIARIPIEALQAFGPLVFFGVPTILTLGIIGLDTYRNKAMNRVFVVGAVLMIASFPARLAISGTESWTNFAAWVVTWAA